jgi:CRP-like cAMP-binding protein
MAARKAAPREAAPDPSFNAQAFLDAAGVAKTSVQYGRGETIFSQGDSCKDVMYIQAGGVKLSVLSKTGKEAVVAMLGPATSSARDAWRASACAWGAPRPSRRA